MSRLGIFAKTFPRPDARATLEAVRDAGLEAVQFNMACVGLPPLPDDGGADAVVYEVRAALAATGLEASALSGTCNLIHPDAAFRVAERRKLMALIRAAPAMGFSLVTLCTGTRDPDDPWRAHPENGSREAWSDLLDAFADLVLVAEDCGVALGVEPETGNVVATPADARRLLGDLGSARVGVIVDPANLEEHPTPESNRDALQRAFDAVGDRIVLAHAKDRTTAGGEIAAGQGAVDFSLYQALLDKAGYGGPLILHGLGEADVRGALLHLREAAGGAARMPGRTGTRRVVSTPPIRRPPSAAG